jgi:hypothetical protein
MSRLSRSGDPEGYGSRFWPEEEHSD